MIILLQLFSIISLSFCQSWHNHPELDWQTIETEHFLIHFHLETKRSAEEAAVVAEHIYEPITNYYEYEPDSKTHIIIKDVDDISNGAAYYYNNKIVIWALPIDFDLRGAHRWLNNVITHEFTHIVQIGASMKYSRKFPASFIQYLNYENEKREDVLYGYPNVIISYPIPGVSVPPWFAEGTAQFMYENANFDFWDSHRDMIVRERVLNDNLLSFNAMNSFGKRGIGNESSYNQGFLFCSWLVEKFGKNILKKITDSLSNPFNYSINKAILEVTGKSGSELYEQWANELSMNYNKRIENVKENINYGKIIIEDGTTSIHPIWSPNDKKFLYLSNKENDYFSQTDLYVYQFSDSNSYKIASNVYTAATWVNDSTIIYTKRSKPNKWGSKLFDLYSYTFKTKKEKRLTTSRRFTSPTYNSNTKQLAVITSFDGTSNILIASDVDIDEKEILFKPMTLLDNGMQIFSLSWVKNELYVDALYHQGRQIYKLDFDSGLLESITNSHWDNRDQTSMGGELIYVKDQSGIFNIVINKNGIENYITNVTGGAFMPSVSNNGKILYSLFQNGSYKIAYLDSITVIANRNVGYELDYFSNHIKSELILASDDYPSKPYNESMLSISIIPKIMIDYNTLKMGTYFFNSEVIDRFSFFGGFSANKIWDLDAFLMLEYRKYKPTFYTNLFWITRNRYSDKNNPFLYPRVDGTNVDNIHIFNDLSFSLFSSDIGARMAYGLHKYQLQYTFSNYRQHVIQNVYQYAEYDSMNVIHQRGEIGFDYYRGHSFSLLYDLDLRKPSYIMNMLPSKGLKIHAKLSYELNQFMDGFSVSEEHSTFGANFVPNNTFRFIMHVDKHFTLNKRKKIVFSSLGSLGWISNSKVDDFFHFFNGGLPGMKGYTFYEPTLSGPAYFIGTFTTRMPLFMEKDYPFGYFNLQNLSVGSIFQFGGASNIDFSNFLDNHKLSLGFEIRLKGFSFYSYPTAIGYEFHRPIGEPHEKGKHYLTLLFDY